MVHSPLICQMPKRQRRLTLTAMTGALGDLSQDEVKARLSTGSLMSVTEKDVEQFLKTAPRPSLTRRDSSPTSGVVTFRGPVVGAKRTRDSLGPDIGAQRMMQRAQERVAACQAKDNSDSSDSEPSEDEEARQRRQKAFECGVKAADGMGQGNWAETVGQGTTLSPRSFARGARAAEVAAKMAKKMEERRAAAKAENPLLQAAQEASEEEAQAPLEPAPKRHAGPKLLAPPPSWGGGLEAIAEEAPAPAKAARKKKEKA